MSRTLHDLNPTTDERDLRRREECAAQDHLPLTFNPNMAVTFCRCGHARYPGDQGPKHTILCRYPQPEVRNRYGLQAEAVPGLCSWDCQRAIAEGLPRDYDPADQLPGQTDLLALLEEDR